MLDPAFGRSTNDTYTVTVPTDIQIVDIEVDVGTTTTSTVTINNLGTTPASITDIGSPPTWQEL